MRKLCKACNSRKALDKFYINRKAKDGRQSWCKDCQREFGFEYRKPSLRGRFGKKDPWYSKKIRDVLTKELRKAIKGIAA